MKVGLLKKRGYNAVINTNNIYINKYKYNINTKDKKNKFVTSNKYILNLTYKRNKFYPSLGMLTNNYTINTLITCSLGLLNVYSKNKRSLKTNKINFVKSAEFLKKILLSLGKLNVEVWIKGVPKFLKDILREMFGSSSKYIANPFTSSELGNSISTDRRINFSKIVFNKNYPYKNLKIKKKGKVKRKIRRKIFSLNNLID